MSKVKKKIDETIQVETEVKYMKDPEVEYVSLVSYGANNTGFKVVKSISNKEGDKMPTNKIIQSYLIDEDVNEAHLQKIVGGDVKLDEVEKQGKRKLYKQVDLDLCDLSTKSTILIDAGEKEGEENVSKSIYGIVYATKGKEEDNISEEPDMKEVEGVSVKNIGFYDVWEEFMALGDIISGAMSQSANNTEERHSLVTNATNKFAEFVDIVFQNALAEKTYSPEKAVERKTLKKIESLENEVSTFLKGLNIKKESEMAEELFKTKEEMAQFIMDTVQKTLDTQSQKDKAEKAAKEKEDAAKAAAEAKDAEIAELKETVKSMKESVDKLGGTVTSKTSQSDESSNNAPSNQKGKESVFKGLFLKSLDEVGISDLN